MRKRKSTPHLPKLPRVTLIFQEGPLAASVQMTRIYHRSHPTGAEPAKG